MAQQKMTLAAAVLLVALGGSGQAIAAEMEQGREVPPGQSRGQGRMGKRSVADRLARMTVRLNLTEEQQARIKPLLEEEEKQCSVLRNDPALTRDQKRSGYRQIRADAFAGINAVLTPEQREKHEEMRERARERGEKRRKPAP